jgi:glycosyltransferase involved in cell wall biosynthesis
MTAVVVDWLGRGGIAQTTPSWVRALERAGHDVVVVTRGGRELTGSDVRTPIDGPHALVTHHRLARLAADTVDDLAPELVVVQNYVIPPLEGPLDRALRRSAARSVVVIHDHRLHSRAAGARTGLRRRIRSADVVVAHSRFVARALTEFSGRSDLRVVPLPTATVGGAGVNRLAAGDDASPDTAIGFGVLRRSYKGVDVVGDLAATGLAGWRFAVAGTGAPTDLPGVAAVPGYLSTPDLAATVGSATAAVLPYRFATQSAAVLFAQQLGVVPVASATGGIVEQIEDRVDGVLVPSGASLAAWQDALRFVHDHRDRLAAGACARAEAADVDFERSVGALV